MLEYIDEIKKALPALARAGYPYEKIKAMPTWLFWELADSENVQRVRDRLDVYEAVGAAGGGFNKKGQKETIDKWNYTLGLKNDPNAEPFKGVNLNDPKEFDRQWKRAFYNG